MIGDMVRLARWLELAEAEGVARAVRAGMARGEALQVDEIGLARLVDCGAESSLTRVYGFGFDPPDPAVLDRIEGAFAARALPARIELSPYADAGWMPLLRARAWGIEGWKEVLVRGLDDLPRVDPPGVAVRKVDRADPDDVARAAHLVGRGFHEGEEPKAHEVANGRRMITQPDALAFVATVEGVPAGGGTVVHGEGRAVLIAASTLPEHRRRGVQSALMAARLAAARALGLSLAVVQAAPGVATRRNAERLGFRLAYTRVTLTRDRV